MSEGVAAERAKESDERRSAILDAAEALIVSEGLEGFRVREVAQRAGLHHASMLYYFPNRTALIRGVVERIITRLERIPQGEGEPGDQRPCAVLQAHFQHIVAQMISHPNQFTALSELYLRAGRDEEVRRVLESTDTAWRAYLTPLLQAGIDQGDFRRDLDPSAVALVIISFFRGTHLQLSLPANALQTAVDQLVRWICQPG